MKTQITIAILLFIFPFHALSQAPDTLWTKWYGGIERDRTNNICETTDGGFISCGHSNSFSNVYQTWLIRLDSNGDTLWTKILGDSERPEDFNSLEETVDKGFIACGGYFGNDNKYHTYLMKLKPNGDVEWKKVIGTTNNSDLGIKARQITDNGFIILAHQQGSGSGFWLYKTDEYGNLTDSAEFDWINYDVPADLAITDDGGYVIAGISNSFGTSTEWEDMFLFKVSSSLDSLWLRLYANQDSLCARMNSVMKTSDGGYLLVGAQEQFPNAQNKHDFLVIKTNNEGNEQWQKLYGGPRHEVGFSCIELPNKDYILTGAGSSSNTNNGFDAFVIRINNLGDTIWTKYYGTPGFDELTQIKPVKAGGYILAGISYYFSKDPNKSDIYFIRIKSEVTSTPDLLNGNIFFSISPNPFSESTSINYELQTAGRVRIDIFNSLGEKITTLVDEWQEAGRHSEEFRITNYELSAGMYYYRIQIGDRIESGKMMLIR